MKRLVGKRGAVYREWFGRCPLITLQTAWDRSRDVWADGVCVSLQRTGTRSNEICILHTSWHAFDGIDINLFQVMRTVPFQTVNFLCLKYFHDYLLHYKTLRHVFLALIAVGHWVCPEVWSKAGYNSNYRSDFYEIFC